MRARRGARATRARLAFASIRPLGSVASLAKNIRESSFNMTRRGGGDLKMFRHPKGRL